MHARRSERSRCSRALHGSVGVQLHVFGDNAGARRLYVDAGYAETNVTMLKRVTR